ncbi:MAG TPA: LacI family DNA-binding transcriptional regulator [Gaiellaceae bacterium]|nr:LacI family DNA-binding transcriptional regulator [Gaiellaceae bacterium]
MAGVDPGAALTAATVYAAHRGPVTLADVARAAGTSASTASRALNGRGYVSEDARARLLLAAERLGYVANASARTLKQKRSRVVGVVVSDLRNQFYADLAAGVGETLRAADYQMVLLSDNVESEREVMGARTFLAMRAAGVILTPVGREAASLLVRNGIDVVEVDRQLADAPCDAVVVDNARGAEEATSHLLDLGHRRVALLVPETDWTTDAGRLRGYRQAHAAAGVPVDERLVLSLREDAPDVEERIGRLLDEGRPTAIFAANNVLAEHAWRVLRRRELKLPHDVSLVGFDDVRWMEMVEPGITAVAQPTVELGRTAARLLLERAEGVTRPPRVECLPPELVVRGSTAPPA